MSDYLTPSQLVDRWNKAVTKGTLSNWRVRKYGPKFTKFGRSVRYKLSDVEAFERQLANDNTPADPAKEGAA